MPPTAHVWRGAPRCQSKAATGLCGEGCAGNVRVMMRMAQREAAGMYARRAAMRRSQPGRLCPVSSQESIREERPPAALCGSTIMMQGTCWAACNIGTCLLRKGTMCRRQGTTRLYKHPQHRGTGGRNVLELAIARSRRWLSPKLAIVASHADVWACVWASFRTWTRQFCPDRHNFSCSIWSPA